MEPKTPANGPTRGIRLSADDGAHALREFAQCASALRDLFYDDRRLNEEECLFMDKHFQVLQMAYLRWKRVHGLPH
jgi:hypothetical protein